MTHHLLRSWTGVCAMALTIAAWGVPVPIRAADDGGLFHQMDIGLLSVGGRATYFDPEDAGARWFGGGQVRLHPSRYFAIEGSADYRRNDFGNTRTHTYPVQASALIYPLGTTRLAPFILGGGGWYYTTVDSMPEVGCSSSSTATSRSTVPTATFGLKGFHPGIKTSWTRNSKTTAT